MAFVSTPLPVGRDVFPLELFDPDKRVAIEVAAMAERRPPRWLDLGAAQIPSRAWYEWHWHRGIDPDKKRNRRLPPGLRQFIIDRDGLLCALCGSDVERDDVHIDHIKPVVLGGSDAPSNLQVSHSSCNIQKGARFDG